MTNPYSLLEEAGLLKYGGAEALEKNTDFQVVNRLREAASRLAEVHTFKPRQIIILKQKSDGNRVSSGDPIIFLNYLEAPINPLDFMNELENLTSSIGPQVFDCVIGRWHNGAMLRHYDESSAYEPHPDFQD